VRQLLLTTTDSIILVRHGYNILTFFVVFGLTAPRITRRSRTDSSSGYAAKRIEAVP